MHVKPSRWGQNKNCHNCVVSRILSQVQDDTLFRKGFTLVELLIAVVIIGVLVAVAVPQYQKAVLKSRFSSLMPLGKALHDGNESYYLEHGSYTNDPTKLDVKSNNSNAQITLGNQDKHKYVLLTRNDMHNKLVMYQKNSEFFPNEIHCEAQKDNEQANWLCEGGLKGTLLTERALSDGYNTYLLQGTGNGGFPKTWKDVSDQILERGDSCISTEWGGSCNNVEITDGKCANRDWYTRGFCSHSIFTNSTCVSNTYGGCSASTFNNSTCEAHGKGACSNDGTTFNNSVCYGFSGDACRGRDPNNTIPFNNSECYAYQGWACHQATFYNSKCYGEAYRGCIFVYFHDHSVCYANAKEACTYSSYDATSYCDGKFCPNNAPSGTAGKKWYRGTGEDWPDDRPSELVNK